MKLECKSASEIVGFCFFDANAKLTSISFIHSASKRRRKMSEMLITSTRVELSALTEISGKGYFECFAIIRRLVERSGGIKNYEHK